MPALTVAVNLLWLVPGHVGGTEESTVASLRGLADAAADDVDVRLFALEPFARAHPDLVAALPTEVLPLSGRSRAVRVAGEATWLARRTARAALVHHAGGTAPPRTKPPYVLTLHDLQPLEASATHGPGKRAYLGVVVPRSLRRARLVVVPSEFVRATVLARSGYPFTAVPSGAQSRSFLPAAETRKSPFGPQATCSTQAAPPSRAASG